MVTEKEHDWLIKQNNVRYCTSCYQEIDPDQVPSNSKICKPCIQILEKIDELEKENETILFK